MCIGYRKPILRIKLIKSESSTLELLKLFNLALKYRYNDRLNYTSDLWDITKENIKRCIVVCDFMTYLLTIVRY